MEGLFKISLALVLLASCRSHHEIEQRETQQVVSVQSVAASELQSDTERWHEVVIREVVTMQADSAGIVREVARVTTTERRDGERGRKTENKAQKLDSTAFSSENKVSYKETKENAGERSKTRFWRNSFFYIVMFAAIVTLIVILWHKTNLKSWVKRLIRKN